MYKAARRSLDEGGTKLKYVYIIRSIETPDRYYTGLTGNVDRRLSDHNYGKSPHTSKYAPWKLVSFTAFTDDARARAFEKYLKSGSGRAFAVKHLR